MSQMEMGKSASDLFIEVNIEIRIGMSKAALIQTVLLPFNWLGKLAIIFKTEWMPWNLSLI